MIQSVGSVIEVFHNDELFQVEIAGKDGKAEVFLVEPGLANGLHLDQVIAVSWEYGDKQKRIVQKIKHVPKGGG